VRVQDRDYIDSDRKWIFLSRAKEEVLNRFTEFLNKRSRRYPGLVHNIGINLSILLKDQDYL
jgi:transposase-like protein